MRCQWNDTARRGVTWQLSCKPLLPSGLRRHADLRGAIAPRRCLWLAWVTTSGDDDHGARNTRRQGFSELPGSCAR